MPPLCPLPPRGMELDGGACRRCRRSVGANAPSTLPAKDDRWQRGAEASRLVFGVDVKPRPGRTRSITTLVSSSSSSSSKAKTVTNRVWTRDVEVNSVDVSCGGATRVNGQEKSLTAAAAAAAVYWCLLPTTSTSIPKCRLAEVAAITAKPKMRVPKMKTQEMIPFAIASP
ncbi:hypothetical protein T12_9758 [Trichinella patagoniensis]|uniref:Uncharacterized protein n=1 Tax=Trichinella patagoniensis TaxID=990121 RepID=A0A0V0ZHY7_9BILA|nr:hypothetical protein T12_9758 [Trichinella patagoniensis]